MSGFPAAQPPFLGTMFGEYGGGNVGDGWIGIFSIKYYRLYRTILNYDNKIQSPVPPLPTPTPLFRPSGELQKSATIPKPRYGTYATSTSFGR